MTRARRLVWWAGAAIAGLCLIAALSSVAVLRSEWFGEQVRRRIVREIESATGGRAEIGLFRFDWNQMRAEVRSLVLHGAEAAGQPPLLRAESVELRLKIVSMLRRDVDLQSLVIGRPRVRLTVYPDGGTNLPQPAAARRRARPLEPFLGLAIDSFRIEGGLIEINDTPVPLEISCEDLTAHLVFEGAGPRYRGDVSFRRLRLVAPAAFAAAMDADLSLSLEADRLVFREARLRTERSSASLTGAVEGLLSPRLDAAVKARISLPEAQSLAGAPALARGMVELAGRLVYGGRTDYSLGGRLTGAGLAVEIGGSRISGLGLASDLKLDARGIELGGLELSGLGGRFAGRAAIDRQRRFQVAGVVEQLRLSALAPLGRLKPLPWDGLVSGPLKATGALSKAAAGDLALAGRFAVEPAEPSRPLRGLVDLALGPQAGSLMFGDSRLETASTVVRFSGNPGNRLQAEIETSNLEDVLSAAAYLGPSVPRRIPVSLKNGSARFKGTVAGGAADPRVSGHVSVEDFVYQDRAFDRMEADVTASKSGLEAARLLVEQGDARLQGQARLTLEDWKLAHSGPVSGKLDLRGVPLEDLVAAGGREMPASGVVAGTVQFAGTLREPELAARLVLSRASFYGQPFDQVRVQGRYAARSLLVESLEAEVKAARLRGSGVFTHAADDWRSGSLRFEASGKDLRLADLRAAARVPEELDGALDLQVRGSGSLDNARVLLTELQANASARKISWEGKVAGDLQAAADSRNGQLALRISGGVLGSAIQGQGTCALRDNYPFRGEVRFSRTTLSRLRPWLGAAAALPPVEASADGTVYLAGSALQPDSWTARVEMPGVEILLPPDTKVLVPGLRNAGLVVLAVNRKSVRVVSASFSGPDTNVRVAGGVDLANRFNAYDLRIRGSVNLGILRDFDPSLTASGHSSVDAAVRGPQARPEFYGRLEFKGASFYLSNVPNGLENASGVVLLFRNRATIEKLTAETGGGKLSLKGFVGFGEPQWSFGLQASATNVRVRYPEGVSTSLDAALTLTGTSGRSLVGGTVTVLRSGVSPEVDLAALISRAAQPLVTPAIRNELLRGMQIDVRVEAAPNARLDTMLTRNIQAEAEMRLRGTPYKPVLLGRINVNQGEVSFLGNRYTISRGEISFLNPVRLEPVLSLDLETRVRGIDVTLSFTGPADRLNLSYRSDPPLQLQEIIALLALGRAPSADPTLLARQSDQDQSWSQVGASTLVGQALDAAVTSRVQRFFGVSRIKIDPKLTGLANKPGAQITLEQQISRDITFTYVTSLAQEQQQLVRVEWNVSRQWSLLAVREENGLLGVEVQFRRQFK